MKKGFKISEKTREKIKKNHSRYWLGKKRPELKGVLTMKGKKHSQKTKLKMSLKKKGKIPKNLFLLNSIEIKKKSGLAKKGKPFSGIKCDWEGKKHSQKSKDKMRIAHLGEKSSFWKGGISLEEYPQNWTKLLRRSIRERDNYICQICGDLQCEYIFAVHHIDYNKKNCDPKNLITLCRKCHAKTNSNRKYWISIFNSKV